MCIGHYVKDNYTCQILNKLEFSRQIFEKCSNIKFHDTPSSGAELFHGDRWTDGHTDLTKLTVPFRNSENAPKRKSFIGFFVFVNISCKIYM